MRVEDFEDFCAQVIDKYIDGYREYQKDYKCLYECKFAKSRIFRYYQRKRDVIKNNYMENPGDAEKSLDRHKVAACMMYAILKCRIWKVNRFVPHLPDKLLMANEYLAVYVAINIMEQYRIDDGKSASEYKIIFPITYHETSSGESDYLSNLCKSLYYLRHKVWTMDIFAYSNIMFFLEKYTDTVLTHDKLMGKEL